MAGCTVSLKGMCNAILCTMALRFIATIIELLVTGVQGSTAVLELVFFVCLVVLLVNFRARIGKQCLLYSCIGYFFIRSVAGAVAGVVAEGMEGAGDSLRAVRLIALLDPIVYLVLGWRVWKVRQEVGDADGTEQYSLLTGPLSNPMVAGGTTAHSATRSVAPSRAAASGTGDVELGAAPAS